MQMRPAADTPTRPQSDHHAQMHAGLPLAGARAIQHRQVCCAPLGRSAGRSKRIAIAEHADGAAGHAYSYAQLQAAANG